MTTTLEQRRAARKAAQASHNQVPVIVIDGDSPPVELGSRAYWTTPSGKTVVLYPSAYRWQKVYHRSTVRVEVGAQWLERVK